MAGAIHTGAIPVIMDQVGDGIILITMEAITAITTTGIMAIIMEMIMFTIGEEEVLPTTETDIQQKIAARITMHRAEEAHLCLQEIMMVFKIRDQHNLLEKEM